MFHRKLNSLSSRSPSKISSLSLTTSKSRILLHRPKRRKNRLRRYLLNKKSPRTKLTFRRNWKLKKLLDKLRSLRGGALPDRKQRIISGRSARRALSRSSYGKRIEGINLSDYL